MLPKLTPLQWLLALALLFFYGFTVFAVTRDYYFRHPPRPAVADQATSPAANPGGNQSALGERMRAALGADDAAVPREQLERDPALMAREADRLFVARRYPEAIALYRRLLELDPTDSDASNDLGLALHYSGDTDAALSILQAGAEAAPTFQRIWLSLGFIAAQAGNGEQARTALTRARELDPASEVGSEAQRLLDLLAP